MTIIFLYEIPILFSTVKLKLRKNFTNSTIESKFEFWNVDPGLCILPSFSQFTKEMGNWDFRVAFFSQVTKEFENKIEILEIVFPSFFVRW